LIVFAPVFVEVAKTHDLPLGRAKAVDVGGRIVAIYHTNDGFFATDNTCPHRGGPLAEGDLAGNEITCPWHLWGFDVVSGACPGNPEVSVTTHEVRIEGDSVQVRLS
jgi:nitrite reductase (NADH) small subunit